jgi:hypothetical protein
MNSAENGTAITRRIRRGLLGGAAESPQGLWVSHAERAAITDELSRHYIDGRLNDDEFSRRLDQALKATTYQDLAGLLHDLPPADRQATDASLDRALDHALRLRA